MAWELKSTKMRTFLVYIYTSIMTMGVLAIFYGAFSAADFINTKTRDGFWGSLLLSPSACL
jgi:hypothetical protein